METDGTCASHLTKVAVRPAATDSSIERQRPDGVALSTASAARNPVDGAHARQIERPNKPFVIAPARINFPAVCRSPSHAVKRASQWRNALRSLPEERF